MISINKTQSNQCGKNNTSLKEKGNSYKSPVNLQEIREKTSGTVHRDSYSSKNHTGLSTTLLKGSIDCSKENDVNKTDCKDKTPMCLVNELSRYNKISHQYRLINENGPAHKKKFTVALKLGEEEYTAEGPSIKKAQHTAALEAIKKTKYPHPLPKLKTHKNQKVAAHNITPTVELNSLAMKQGIQVVYMNVNNENEPAENRFLNKDHRKPSNIYEGFKDKPSINRRRNEQLNDCKILLKVGDQIFEGTGNTPQSARHNAALRALETLKPTLKTSNDSQPPSESKKNNSENFDIKSPVSLLYEISVKKQLHVTFEVQNEKGPSHLKVFTTICKVGDLVTEADGNGKKVSRKRAAEKMLCLLQEKEHNSVASVLPNSEKQKKRPQKKKNRNLIKEKLEEHQINPISHLLQLQQSKKEKEPTYTLIEERGAARKREFVMQVESGGYTVTGIGQNKKAAKKAAAHNLLQLMGITLPLAGKTEKNCTTVEENSVLQEQKTNTSKNVKTTVGPKEQLLYLANLLHFQVQFSDFPKGNHGNYLTLVTLSTSPPQLCHGSGSTYEESNANAAEKALQLLRDLGLDIVGNNNKK